MNTLTKLSIIGLILFTNNCFSQGKLALTATQDVRLLITGDDRGNPAATLDIALGLEMQGLQRDFGYIVVRPEFEVANLAGGTYKRYSGNAGVSFNNWSRNLIYTATVGYGFIDHNGTGFSFGNNLQLAYKINDRIQVFADLETVERKDLVRFESESKILGTAWRMSGKFGFKVILN